MNDLIVIEQKRIGNEEINSIDARDLHSRLGVKKDFTNWIKYNIEKLNLIDGTDYLLAKKGEQHPSGVKYVSEFILTLDAGKHIAMMTNTETAKSIRTYFIEFEKKQKTALSAFSNDPFIQLRMNQIAVENRVALLEAKQTTRDESYFTAAGYCNLKGIKLDRAGMAMVGKMAAQFSRENTLKIGKVYDSRYGEVNEYHTSALQYAVEA